MRDEQIAEILARENDEFKVLADEHRSLEGKLSDFTERRYLSSEEEMERKSIQKLKLQKKDRMAELIRRYRKEHAVN